MDFARMRILRGNEIGLFGWIVHPLGGIKNIPGKKGGIS